MKLTDYAAVLVLPMLLAVAACETDPPPAGADAGTETQSCESTDECTVGTTCDIASGECVDSQTCSTHADCGPAATCNEAQLCERSTTGSACETDSDCYGSDSCFHGYCGCAGEEFEAEATPPNVLIVLDRSGSMDESAGGGQTKWQVAVAAVNELVTTYGDNIRFGLTLYSGDGGRSCTPGAVSVDTGTGTAAEITAALSAVSPDGKTPIAATLNAMASYSGLEDTGRENFVLLLTDGKESCSGDTISAVTALRNKTTSIRTFVVGFGDGVDSDSLNAMAVAGGTATGGSDDYYQADDASSLQGAFDSIATDVLGCTYDLETAPKNALELIVYLDGELVDEDTTGQDGWSYDGTANRIEFHGGACTKLRSGTSSQLNIVRSCPFVVP